MNDNSAWWVFKLENSFNVTSDTIKNKKKIKSTE